MNASPLTRPAAAIVLTTLLLAASATLHAQPRHRHPYAGPHAHLDLRHQHNRYYPRHGHLVPTVPRAYVNLVHGGVSFYYSSGVWYRPYGPRFVVAAPPIGIVVPLLPPGYTTVFVGGVPYYYANEVYYARSQRHDGYVVVDPPAGAATAPGSPGSVAQTFVYPNRGQTETQQSTDRYECHRWAVEQTGFDPTQPGADAGTPKRDDYQRAWSACLEGRGYTIR